MAVVEKDAAVDTVDDAAILQHLRINNILLIGVSLGKRKKNISLVSIFIDEDTNRMYDDDDDDRMAMSKRYYITTLPLGAAVSQE